MSSVTINFMNFVLDENSINNDRVYRPAYLKNFFVQLKCATDSLFSKPLLMFFNLFSQNEKPIKNNEALHWSVPDNYKISA